MIDILIRLGGNLHFENNDLIIEKTLLKGGVVSLDSCPDLGPILFGLSSFSESMITFKDIERLRLKRIWPRWSNALQFKFIRCKIWFKR